MKRKNAFVNKKRPSRRESSCEPERLLVCGRYLDHRIRKLGGDAAVDISDAEHPSQEFHVDLGPQILPHERNAGDQGRNTAMPDTWHVILILSTPVVRVVTLFDHVVPGIKNVVDESGDPAVALGPSGLTLVFVE